MRWLRIFLAGALAAASCAAGAALPGAQPVIRLGIMAFTYPSSYTTYIREDDFVLRELPGLLRASLPDYRFEVSVLRTSELVSAARGGKIDIVFGSSGCFAELLPDGVFPIATVVTKRAPDPNRAVAGAVIVRSERTELQKLSDLKGRRAIAGLPGMYFNYQLPASAFFDRGINPETFFSELVQVDYPVEKVLEAVLAGKADAGFIRACVMEELPEGDRSRLRILEPVAGSPLGCSHTSRLFPNWTVGAMPQVSSELARRISVALLTSPPKTEAGIRWSIANSFSQIDDLYRSLKFGRYEYLRHWTFARFWAVSWPFFLAALVGFLALLWHLLRVKRLVEERTSELAREIENRKRLEAENAEASLRFHRLERISTMGQLSNMVAHELRQPLAALHTFLHTIGMVVRKEGIASGVLAKALEGASAQSARIGDIIDHVCSYYRHGRKQETVDVSAVIDEVLREASQIGLTHYPVRCRIAAGPRVLGDPLEIKLVVYNLIKNSVEAAGGEDPGLELALEEAPGEAVLRCSDSARALTEEEVSRIRGLAETTKSDGMGIGLSIVKAVVESHAGTIRFEPNGARGLCVTVRLPSEGGRKETGDGHA